MNETALKLFFIQGTSSPELVRTEFRAPWLSEPLTCIRDEISGGDFSWSRAVQAMAALLLLHGDALTHQAMIEGYNGSSAESFSDAVSRSEDWLIKMYGETPNGYSHAKHIFLSVKSYDQFEPVSVFVNSRFIPSNSISYFLNGDEICPQAISFPIDTNYHPLFAGNT